MDIVVSFAFTYDAKCNFGVCLSQNFCASIFARNLGCSNTQNTPLVTALACCQRLRLISVASIKEIMPRFVCL